MAGNKGKRSRKGPENEVRALAENITREQKHRIDMRENGCSDPFRCDGANLNLTRNHILYDKTVIAGICAENGFPLPGEYFTPTPPEVSDCFMANLEQTERVERLKDCAREFVRKCPAYDTEQLSFL